MIIEMDINELYDKQNNKLSESLKVEIIESFKIGVLSLLIDESFMVDGLEKIIILDNYDEKCEEYFHRYNILNLSENNRGCVIPIQKHFYYILLSKDCLFSFYKDYAMLGFTEKDILKMKKTVVHELYHIDDFNRSARFLNKRLKFDNFKESLMEVMPEIIWSEYYATRKSSEYVDLFQFSKELFEENSCIFSKVLGELELNLLFSLVGVREKVIVKENVLKELIGYLRTFGYILGDIDFKDCEFNWPNCFIGNIGGYDFEFYNLPIHQFLDDIFYTLDYNYQNKISDLSKLYNILSEYINCLWNFLDSKD